MAGREKNCKWFFADQPNGQEVGPNNAMEQNFKGHPYTSLVRESIQNSLDAVLDDSKPVRMEFDFREMEGVDYPHFFDLKEHVQGCLDYYSSNPNAKAIYKPMLTFFKGESKYSQIIHYIKVSDYNTKGMDYSPNKTDSPFYAFVRSAGVSAKDSDNAGGSFGFGKAAYFLMSPISTILVSTQTADGNDFFEGVSSLCTHTVMEGNNLQKKVAVGFYDDSEGAPICNRDAIPKRFRRDENTPGTSIFILGFNYKDWKEAKEEMLTAVLRNFWFAIAENKLEVKIEDLLINVDNIEEIMADKFSEVPDNARSIYQQNPRPYYNAVLYAGSSDKYCYYENTLPTLGHVEFFAYKDKNANDKIVYMRKPRMVVYQKKHQTKRGFCGVFFCDDSKGNDILRNMENPAHDEWKSKNWRVNGRACSKGIEALDEMTEFITDCISKMFDIGQKTVLNIKGLEEFLYIPTSYEEDEELDSESDTGAPTGSFKIEEGTSPTSVKADDFPNPTISSPQTTSSSGHIVINRQTSGVPDKEGNLKSGHGDAERKTKKKGIPKPGDMEEGNKKIDDGQHGIYAEPIYIDYRSFCQEEGGIVYHYIVLHSTEKITNVRLHFETAGEDGGKYELFVESSTKGVISKNIIQELPLEMGSNRIKVKFADNLKHNVILSAEEIYEY